MPRIIIYPQPSIESLATCYQSLSCPARPSPSRRLVPPMSDVISRHPRRTLSSRPLVYKTETSKLCLLPPFSSQLLRGALDALTPGVSILVLLHGVAAAAREPSRMSVRILEVHGVGNGICGGDINQARRREDLTERVKGGRVLCPVLLGELDGELDVHVSKVVVTVGRHALSANHLDSVCWLG